VFGGTMWTVSVMADSGTAVAEAASSGPDWWTLAAGLIGGLVVAVANHFFTRRREWSKWLSERRIEANREFHNAALALAHKTRDGVSEEARLAAVESVPKLDSDLVQKYQALMLVGDASTVSMAKDASEHLKSLAYQALPLPFIDHAAAMDQREHALVAMDNLMYALAYTMRIGAGFSNRKERKQFSIERERTYTRQLLSPVDRGEPKPDFLKFLQDWQVLSIEHHIIGSHLDDYRFGSPIGDDEGGHGHFFVATLRKADEGPWMFNMCYGNGLAREQQILEDVVRIVTGNVHAFRPKYARRYQAADDDYDNVSYSHAFGWSTKELHGNAPLRQIPTSGGTAHEPGAVRRILHRLRSGNTTDTLTGNELRLVSVRRLDALPDHITSQSYPVMGAYTRYTFKIELSREPTRDEMERAAFLFGRSDLRFSPPKTFTIVCTTEEMESHLSDIQLQVLMAGWSMRAGEQTDRDLTRLVETESARADDAIRRMNETITKTNETFAQAQAQIADLPNLDGPLESTSPDHPEEPSGNPPPDKPSAS
jgi:hypothetical protein